MEWYPWLRAPFEQLIGQYQAGRGHHALLLHALPAMGEDTLVYAISRWLMCQQPEGHKSCGHCHSCLLMQAGTHPDSYQLGLEKGKSAIGIDAIRDITEKLYGHAQQGGNKVVRLSDAEKLTEAAANALLKTLEEPPANTWFFLTCRDAAHIPATLRSRCLTWYLAPPDESFALAWLGRKSDQNRQDLLAALRLSSGSPAAALHLLAPERWSLRHKLCDALARACESGDLLSLLPELNHDEAPGAIHWLCTLLVDAGKYQQGATQWLTNNDRLSLVVSLSRLISPGLLAHLLKDWFSCRETLRDVIGVNRELLLTEKLLHWERLMQPGATPPSYPF